MEPRRSSRTPIRKDWSSMGYFDQVESQLISLKAQKKPIAKPKFVTSSKSPPPITTVVSSQFKQVAKQPENAVSGKSPQPAPSNGFKTIRKIKTESFKGKRYFIKASKSTTTVSSQSDDNDDVNDKTSSQYQPMAPLSATFQHLNEKRKHEFRQSQEMDSNFLPEYRKRDQDSNLTPMGDLKRQKNGSFFRPFKKNANGSSR